MTLAKICAVAATVCFVLALIFVAFSVADAKAVLELVYGGLGLFAASHWVT